MGDLIMKKNFLPLLTGFIIIFIGCSGGGSKSSNSTDTTLINDEDAVFEAKTSLERTDPTLFLTGGDIYVNAIRHDLNLPTTGENETIIEWAATFSAYGSDA